MSSSDGVEIEADVEPPVLRLHQRTLEPFYLSAYYHIERRERRKLGTRSNREMRQSGLDWSTRPPKREVLNPLPWIERSVVSFVPVSECPDEPHTGETEVNEKLRVCGANLVVALTGDEAVIRRALADLKATPSRAR
jgi:hypothetical protein